MFDWPTSSPQTTRMFGWSAATAVPAHRLDQARAGIVGDGEVAIEERVDIARNLAQRLGHLPRGRHHGLHVVALRHREATRHVTGERRRQPRYVVVQVVFEVGVIGLDQRCTEPAREPHSGVVRHERRLDVHKIHFIWAQRAQVRHQLGPHEEPIFRVTRHGSRRNAHDLRIGAAGIRCAGGRTGLLMRRAVLRGHQRHAVPERLQIGAEGLNRR